jgi:hypothetical protein
VPVNPGKSLESRLGLSERPVQSTLFEEQRRPAGAPLACQGDGMVDHPERFREVPLVAKQSGLQPRQSVVLHQARQAPRMAPDEELVGSAEGFLSLLQITAGTVDVANVLPDALLNAAEQALLAGDLGYQVQRQLRQLAGTSGIVVDQVGTFVTEFLAQGPTVKLRGAEDKLPQRFSIGKTLEPPPESFRLGSRLRHICRLLVACSFVLLG